MDADVYLKNLNLVTITEQNYDIENLTKRSGDLTPFKTDLNLDADDFLKKSKTWDKYRIMILKILLNVP